MPNYLLAALQAVVQSVNPINSNPIQVSHYVIMNPTVESFSFFRHFFHHLFALFILPTQPPVNLTASLDHFVHLFIILKTIEVPLYRFSVDPIFNLYLEEG